jgi:hypothetical protein
MQRETVAAEYSVSDPYGPDHPLFKRMDSRRDVLGCSRNEKNGSTTSKK